MALGWTLFGLVVIYNVVLPVVGRALGYHEWVRLWAFLLPLSVLMVIPDSVLAEVYGSIQFPESGGPRIGPLPLAMAGMWVIPLWITVTVAEWWPGSTASRTICAALVGGLILVIAEGAPWTVAIWEAVGVRTVGGAAMYVVLPEILLCAATYMAYVETMRRSVVSRLVAAVAVPLIYLGALGTSYYVIERVLA